MRFPIRFVFFILFFCASQLSAQNELDPATKQLADGIFKQLIEINTTDTPAGNVSTAAKAMQQRFLSAGFPASDVHLLGPNERKQNLVVRLHGSGAKPPILLIGHLDVVQALPADWSTDPFKLVEKDGYYYGRGTQDIKSGDAILVTTLLRFKQEGYKPDRDLILALTADEEGGHANGIDWLVQNHRDLINAEYVFNVDGGGPLLMHGKPYFIAVDANEKAYADYQLTVHNPGGHSSLPRSDNAIYELTAALTRLQQYQFPFEMNPVTRAEIERMATLESGERAADLRAVLKTPPDDAALRRLYADPSTNSILRTTCVTTMLNAGHARNALPQSAQANVNCRIFPGHTREQIRQQLIKIFDDPKITVTYVADNGDTGPHAPNTGSLPPQAVNPEFIRALETTAARFWPGAPVVPSMAAGASDAIYTNAVGIPTYNVNVMAQEITDIRAHGKDERIRVADFDTGVVFCYDLLKALTSEERR